jgi:hypothetical protein
MIVSMIANARYSRYVVVEFDSGKAAKEFFYRLGEEMGYEPRKGKNHYPPGTGLDWAMRQLSPKNAEKLTRKKKS